MHTHISIIHNMARSGGTLIVKCLACMNGIIMLSEIHPEIMQDPFNPLTQANNWYKLFRQDDLLHIMNANKVPWLQAIELINRRSMQTGNQLLIRDWSHIDFTGVPWFQNPSFELTTAKLLANYYHIKNICTVRHPIDQWISLSKLAVIKDQLDIATYLKGYRAFAEKAYETGYIRYEDFTAAPQIFIEKICNKLGLRYDPTFMEKWFKYTNITGDTSNSGGGRATQNKEIVVLKKRTLPKDLMRQFEHNIEFKRAIEILGYDS